MYSAVRRLSIPIDAAHIAGLRRTESEKKINNDRRKTRITLKACTDITGLIKKATNDRFTHGQLFRDVQIIEEKLKLLLSVAVPPEDQSNSSLEIVESPLSMALPDTPMSQDVQMDEAEDMKADDAQQVVTSRQKLLEAELRAAELEDKLQKANLVISELRSMNAAALASQAENNTRTQEQLQSALSQLSQQQDAHLRYKQEHSDVVSNLRLQAQRQSAEQDAKLQEATAAIAELHAKYAASTAAQQSTQAKLDALSAQLVHQQEQHDEKLLSSNRDLETKLSAVERDYEARLLAEQSRHESEVTALRASSNATADALLCQLQDASAAKQQAMEHAELLTSKLAEQEAGAAAKTAGKQKLQQDVVSAQRETDTQLSASSALKGQLAEQDKQLTLLKSSLQEQENALSSAAMQIQSLTAVSQQQATQLQVLEREKQRVQQEAAEHAQGLLAEKERVSKLSSELRACKQELSTAQPIVRRWQQEEAFRQQQEDVKRQQQLEVKHQQELEVKRQQQLEAKRQQELQVKRQQELEAKRQQELEVKHQQELEVKRQEELELKRQELEVKRQQQLEAKRQQELQVKRQQELEAKRQQELELKRQQADAIRRNALRQQEEAVNRQQEERMAVLREQQHQAEERERAEAERAAYARRLFQQQQADLYARQQQQQQQQFTSQRRSGGACSHPRSYAWANQHGSGRKCAVCKAEVGGYYG
eukprot:TRINITY_DN840_c0_g1_i2.p1 TRINITY_DN840_c0_g1~~TRINITY_DN840_c0_g1_i2.p1  ORF type:complete len:710 (-),score=205.63 TRINITY_DN840_c0_g1_i2:51-2180(-)